MTAAAALPNEFERKLARWAENAGCRLLVLFGSAAEGRAGPRSDLDFALDFATMPDPGSRLKMIGEIQDLCGGRPVDVVYLRTETNPVLRFEVFRSGYPIFEAKEGLFVTEVIRALALYEDALPFRRRLRRRVVGAAEVP